VPEQAKPAIKRAEENILKRLKNNIEKLPIKEKSKFKDYIKNIGGNKIRHLEIINKLDEKEISEYLREIIEKEKENILEKIENKIKTSENKKLDEKIEKMLDHLKKGEIENFRTFNELENNLSPETFKRLLPLKHEIEINLKKKIEEAKTPEKEKELIEKMKEYSDVKQLDILEELDSLISPSKRDLLKKIKNEIEKKIEEKVNKAENKSVIEGITGNNLKGIKIIENLKVPLKVKKKLRKRIIERIERKINFIKAPEKKIEEKRKSKKRE